MPKLPIAFYRNDQVAEIAVQLLGKQLFTYTDGKLSGGTIVETEAYNGIVDKASHAYGGRLTPRTKTMYEAGGISYVYLCYGIHSLFNVVTGIKGVPHAVLIRGLEPVEGVETMLLRRKMFTVAPRLSAGPGALSQALGITRNLNGKSLLGQEIWIEDNGIRVEAADIVASKRIGVDYAGDDALLPYRFYIRGNKFVSKPTGK